MQHKKTKKQNTRKLKVIAKLAKMECELFKSNEQYPSLVMRCRSGALNIFYKTETATETEPKKTKEKSKRKPKRKPKGNPNTKPLRCRARRTNQRTKPMYREGVPSAEHRNNLHVHILHRNPKLMLML